MPLSVLVKKVFSDMDAFLFKSLLVLDQILMFFLRMLVSALSQGCDLKAWIPPGVAHVVSLDSRWYHSIIWCRKLFKKRAKFKSQYSCQPEGKYCIAQSFAVERLVFSSCFAHLCFGSVHFWEGQAPQMVCHFSYLECVSRL